MNINKKGVSLIILVITIIVMIIIASAIILYLTDNNVIDSANTAVNKTNFNAIQDAAREEASNYLLNNEDYETAEEYIKAKLIANNVITEEQANNYSFNDEGTIIEKSEKEIKYVKTNLQLWLDGINNTRAGHSSSATVWEDLSGNNNDFTMNNISIADDYMSFNGGSWATNGHMTLSNRCTVEILVKIISTNSNGFLFIDNSKRTRIGISTRIFSRAFVLKTGSSTEQYPMTAPNTMNEFITNFALMTVVYNDSNVSWYINGIKSTFDTALNYWNQNNINIVSIGARNTGSYNTGLIGNIRCVRVYDRCLSQEEITSNYNVDVARFGGI